MRIPARLMPHTVDVEPAGIQSPSGVTPAAPVTVRAYVEDTSERIATTAGSELVAATSVWLDPDTGVHPGGHVTIRHGTKPGRRRVLAVDRYRHPGAPSHDVARLE